MRPSSRRPDSMTGRRGDLCCARTIAWRSLRLQSTFSTSLCNMKQQDCSELRYHTAKRRYAINGSRCRKLSSFHATTAGLCSGLPVHRARRILFCVGTKSRETIYGASIRAAAERATEERKQADRLAVQAWNKRMLGFQGPAQPSPSPRSATRSTPGTATRTVAFVSKGDSDARAGFGDFDDLGGFGNAVGSRSNV